MPGVYYAEEEQADGDFHECESNEGLDPIGPAQDLEQSSLCSSQVVLMSSQSVENFRRNQSSANQRRYLVEVDGSMVVYQERGFLIGQERALTMAATAT